MSSQAKATRDRWIKKLTGLDFRTLEAKIDGLEPALRDLQQFDKNVAEHLHHLQQQMDVAEKLAVANNRLLASARDNIPHLRHLLQAVRDTPAYNKAFTDPNPLVTVRIPSYNKTEALMEIAVASVLRQTHKNFELIIVNDGPNEKTKSAIKKLGDKRITYVELPFRTKYPEDRMHRWMVAGSPGMNVGAHLARGSWIAPLDDDDSFTDDHIEKLLAAARHTRSEMVYGALNMHETNTGKDNHIWSFPPELGQFSFQGAMYLKALGFFEYDQESWLVGEPGDWNLCRRMMAAGVRMHAIEDVVGTMNMVPFDQKVEG